MKKDTTNENLSELKNAGEYIIPANKSKKLKDFFTFLIVLALCVFIILFDVEKFRELIAVDSIFDNFFDNILLLIAKVLSCAMIPLIVFCLIISIKNIFSKKDLLYINEKGFEENISNQALGFVEWSDVEKLTVKQFFNAKFFGISLKSPEKYYKNKKFKTTTKQQEDIRFTSQFFNDKAEEVEKIIKYHIDKNKE